MILNTYYYSQETTGTSENFSQLHR